MANQSESRENNSSSKISHEQSGLSSTQNRSGEKTREGAGGGIGSGRPDAGGNRSGGQGNVSQQSNVDADHDGASRQTSDAQNEKGQL